VTRASRWSIPAWQTRLSSIRDRFERAGVARKMMVISRDGAAIIAGRVGRMNRVDNSRTRGRLVERVSGRSRQRRRPVDKIPAGPFAGITAFVRQARFHGLAGLVLVRPSGFIGNSRLTPSASDECRGRRVRRRSISTRVSRSFAAVNFVNNNDNASTQ
jgi:hypothetical protein